MTTQSTHPPPGTWNARNLLTVLEVAEWARVHPKTVYRWIKEGKLEAIQFGPRTFRVPEDAIGKFLHKTGYTKTTALPKPNGREQSCMGQIATHLRQSGTASNEGSLPNLYIHFKEPSKVRAKI